MLLDTPPGNKPIIFASHKAEDFKMIIDVRTATISPGKTDGAEEYWKSRPWKTAVVITFIILLSECLSLESRFANFVLTMGSTSGDSALRVFSFCRMRIHS